MCVGIEPKTCRYQRWSIPCGPHCCCVTFRLRPFLEAAETFANTLSSSYTPSFLSCSSAEFFLVP